jgi:predicted DNA-binding protein (UPF0251 family)
MSEKLNLARLWSLSIGRAAQEVLRRRALVLIEQQGLSQSQAAQLVGVHRQTVNTWVKRCREHGEDGVLDGRRVSPRRGKGILMRPSRSGGGSSSRPPISSICRSACGPVGPCAS